MRSWRRSPLPAWQRSARARDPDLSGTAPDRTIAELSRGLSCRRHVGAIHARPDALARAAVATRDPAMVSRVARGRLFAAPSRVRPATTGPGRRTAASEPRQRASRPRAPRRRSPRPRPGPAGPTARQRLPVRHDPRAARLPRPDARARSTSRSSGCPPPTESQRIGSLIINPGGPGGSGVDLVAKSGEAVPELRSASASTSSGFDPRGVNASSPVRCIDDLDRQAELDPVARQRGGARRLVDQAQEYADACAKRNDRPAAVPVDRRRRGRPRPDPRRRSATTSSPTSASRTAR